MQEESTRSILRSLAHGPAAAPELAQETGLSQPVLSRRIRALEDQGAVLRLGRARATRYGRLRNLDGRGARHPVYAVTPEGDVLHAAELAGITPNGFAVTSVQASNSAVLREGFFPSLPFYLQQMRPEGFLGRALVKSLASDLGLPADLRSWNEDHVLSFLVRRGEDMSGNWIIGRASLERFMRTKVVPVNLYDRPALARLMEQALSGDVAGSSAGGEQPKFTAFLTERDRAGFHAIIKFSPDDASPAAERWRDLLIAENLALRNMAASGLPAAESSTLTYAGRIYLVVRRFDRNGERGRRPYIALGYVDDEFLGQRRSIRDTAAGLHRIGKLDDAVRDILVETSLFGDFIGNTDQHHGNVSLTYDRAGLHATPAYDVLPMHYAPRVQGNLPEDLHELPVRFPEEGDAFDRARSTARRFWEDVAQHDDISARFRKIGRENAARLR